jgi:cyanophycinase-like exopeptidase/PKD repeat protein
MRTRKIFLSFFLLSFILAIQSNTSLFAQSGYIYSLKGGTVNSTSANPSPAVMLIGGAEVGASWGDAATEWFLQHADGGDYLVIRYGSTGGQASWVWSNWSNLVSSAAEIAINTIDAANNPVVEQYILNAEAIFFAGGDQDNYENTWKNTLVEDAINYAINVKGVPVNGTSAGMAILGESYYAPSGSAVLGSQILNDPYHSYASDIWHGDFINVPILNNVITETHADRSLSGENRYSRAFGFLARVYADNGNQLPSYAIICEEATHVCIDGNGIAKVYGNGAADGAAAYFLQTNGVGPETIQSGSELVWYNNGQAVKAYHIEGEPNGSGSFNLNDWYTASGGDWEDWFTTGGYDGFNYIGGTCSGCTGAEPPGGGTTCNIPSGLSSGNVTVNSANLSWNSTSAISYDLRYKKTSESNWTQQNLSSTSTTVSGLSPLTDYEFQVRSNCSTTSSNYSSSSYFTTLSDQVTYCSSSGNSTSYEWIAGVTVDGNTNNSGANGYTDFTNITFNLSTDVSYDISLVPGFSGSSYNEYWRIWIDLNKDGDFTDNGENVFDAGSVSNSAVNGSIIIPAGTEEGITRMRISMKYDAAPTSCESFNYGEVEDYTVNITAGTPPQNQDPTAVINGPYTGTVGQAVSFSSAGSNDPDGSITSYLWNFGDGSTSTQANPSHTYSTDNTYTVSLTVTDNDGATDNQTTTATITTSGGGGDTELAFSHFENGWGIWTDGGRDCGMYSDGSRAHSGSYAVNIQDNSGVSSSFYMTNGMDVHSPGYTQIEVEFYFYAYSMENGEDFWLQYFNGSNWITVASFISGTDFNNGSFYAENVLINEADYTFPTKYEIAVYVRCQCKC